MAACVLSLVMVIDDCRSAIRKRSTTTGEDELDQSDAYKRLKDEIA